MKLHSNRDGEDEDHVLITMTMLEVVLTMVIIMRKMVKITMSMAAIGRTLSYPIATIPVFGPLQQMRFLAPNTCVWIRATDVVYGPKHEVPATGL